MGRDVTLVFVADAEKISL